MDCQDRAVASCPYKMATLEQMGVVIALAARKRLAVSSLSPLGRGSEGEGEKDRCAI